MAKKCVLCGKNASFLEGGGDFRGKTLCRECYDKAATAKSDEEMNAMGFNEVEIRNTEEYPGKFYITALRASAWAALLGFFILCMMIWSNEGTFMSGFMNLLIGFIIFSLLYVLSIIAENVIAIRINLESKDKGTQ